MEPQGLYINNKFFSFAEMHRNGLLNEIATRENSAQYYTGMFHIFPDPDLVLKKAGNSVETYNQMMADPHIFGETSKRKALTTSLDFELERGQASARDHKFIEDYIFSNDHELFKGVQREDTESDPDIYDLIDVGLDALFHGYQPVEPVWEKVNGWFLPVKLVDRPREWFHFDMENRLRFRSKDSMIEGELIPDKKMLLFRNKPRYNNPYGEKILSKCFWSWMFKHTTEKWKIQFLEKFAAVWAIGKLPRGKDDKEYDNMFQSLVDLINSGIAVIPGDGSIETIDPAGKGTTSKIFDDNIGLYNDEMSKAIVTVTSLTGQGEGGSRARDEVMERLFKALTNGDKRVALKGCNTLFRWICEVNGKGAAPIGKLLEPEDFNKERADRDTILKGHGVKFSKQYFLDKYNFEEDEIEIEIPSAPPPLDKGKGPGLEVVQFQEQKESPQKVLWDSFNSAALQKIIEPLLVPVITVFNNAKSYEEAMEKATEMLPKLSTEQIEDLVAKFSFLSYIQGSADAEPRSVD